MTRNIAIRPETTLLLLLALAPAAAGAPSCANGLEPRLNGDLFTPVDCSTESAKAPALGEAPVPPSSKASLKELAGRWEGSALMGFGRYELLAELTTHWTGRAEATLELKELQTRQRAAHALALKPAQGVRRYAAELSTRLLPGKTLAGTVVLGVVPSSGSEDSGTRQADMAFANGAAYRVRWTPRGPDALDVRVWISVPGAPARRFDVALKRTTRESL